MKIRFASMILAVGLLFLMVTSAFASEAVEVTKLVQEDPSAADAVFYLDGEPMEGVAAENFGGSYYVALASILPFMDSTSWVRENGEQLTATAQVLDENGVPLDSLKLTLQKDQHYVVANGRYLYLPDGPKSVSGMLAIPVRMLAQVMNMEIHYDAQSGQVNLISSSTPGYLEDAATYYNADSLYWLSRIIYCESGNQSLSGRIAVGNVVMNRVKSSKFPDTVYNVIFQKNQFSPASSKSIYRTPNEGSVIAAKLVLDGAVVLENALFFNTAGLSSYASRNRPYIATIGAHSFYA